MQFAISIIMFAKMKIMVYNIINQKTKRKEINMLFEIDHADIVTSHLCNKHCKHCIDKFLDTTSQIITLKNIGKFLKMINQYTNNKPLEVLLLGGEPTVLSSKYLIEIADLIHKHHMQAIMSTNGILKDKIIEILPYYDSIQVTVNNYEELIAWLDYKDKINIKICGDKNLTINRLMRFIDESRPFYRKSVSMYFTPEFHELCTDKEIWGLLDSMDWKRNGSYMYAFYDGIRFKKCIHGETNIIDEPTVPKLYPNGNYNKTWKNEELDDYLLGNW